MPIVEKEVHDLKDVVVADQEDVVRDDGTEIRKEIITDAEIFVNQLL